MEDAALELYPLRETAFECAIDRFLARQNRWQRHICNRLGDFHGLIHQARGRNYTRNEAGPLGFRRIHHAAGQDQVHRLRLAHCSGEPLRAPNARDDAELDFRLAELGRVRGNDNVGLHGEFAAAAERKAGHRRDDRLARFRNRIPIRTEIPEIGFDKRFVGHLLDVSTGGKGLLVAGDQHAPDLVVGIESLDRARKLIDQGLVECVQGLRAVEPDDSDPAFRFDDNILIAHDTILIQSSFAPERCTTSAHLAESALIVAANSSGVPPAGSSPILANFSLNAADVSAVLMVALSLSTIGRGTPAGAITPVQVGARYPGTPASAIVGSSVKAGERVAPLTPSARTLSSRA